MNKKLLFKYIMLYVPFCIGCMLFIYGVVNLFSSLLLFLGGYVAIKNSLDYRLIRKNINDSKKVSNNVVKTIDDKYNCFDRGIILKRVRRRSRVRRKY